MEGMLIIMLFLALIPACIASSKGRNFMFWYLYGYLLFIVALIHSICLSKFDGANLLVQYKELFDKNVITNSEFESLKYDIMIDNKMPKDPKAPIKLVQYKELFDSKAITESEYMAKKRELLNKLFS